MSNNAIERAKYFMNQVKHGEPCCISRGEREASAIIKDLLAEVESLYTHLKLISMPMPDTERIAELEGELRSWEAMEKHDQSKLADKIIKLEAELAECKTAIPKRCAEIAITFNPHEEHKWLANGISDAIKKEFLS